MMLGKSEKWKRIFLWAAMPMRDTYSGDTGAFSGKAVSLEGRMGLKCHVYFGNNERGGR